MSFVQDGQYDFSINVVSPAKGSIVSVVAPQQVVQSQAFKITLNMKNTGGASTDFRVRLIDPTNNAFYALSTAVTVPSGGTQAFDINFGAGLPLIQTYQFRAILERLQ